MQYFFRLIRPFIAAAFLATFGISLSGCVYNSDGSPDIIASINQDSQSIVLDLQAITGAANAANLVAVNDICAYLPQIFPLWKIAIGVKKADGTPLIPANIINDGNSAQDAVTQGCAGAPFQSFTLAAAGAVEAWDAYLNDVTAANVNIPADVRARIQRRVAAHIPPSLRAKIRRDYYLLQLTH